MVPFVRQSQKSIATLWIPEVSVTVNVVGPGVDEMHLAPPCPSWKRSPAIRRDDLWKQYPSHF
jgi:hypothetical protein